MEKEVENGRPPPRRVTSEQDIQSGASGWLSRSIAVVLSVIVLVTAAMLSVLLLAVLFGVGAIVVGYFWWKTRELRRQMRAYGDDGRAFGDDGRTVDMEVVEKNDPNDVSARR
jgi:Flp pilus assembly protein TadB